MSAHLHSISATDAGDFEVILKIDGERRSIRCRVIERHGIRVVQPEPDLLSTLPFNPRVIVAAVLAFADAHDTSRR